VVTEEIDAVVGWSLITAEVVEEIAEPHSSVATTSN
jgi:hypothetical protein